MEPIYVCFNEVDLDKDQKFILKVGKKVKLKKLFFSTEKGYYITSIKTFIKLGYDNDIKEWQNYKEIENLPKKKNIKKYHTYKLPFYDTVEKKIELFLSIHPKI